MINISTVYDYLIKTKALTKFMTNTQKNCKPNISKFTTDATVLETSTSEDNRFKLDSKLPNPTSAYILQNEDSTEEIIEYDATINIFRHRPYGSTTICNACGMKGHAATKCFRRGIAFLPRDLQCRILAYNSKYGDKPSNDKSTNKDKTILPAPTATIESTSSHISNTMDIHVNNAVVNKLAHQITASAIHDDQMLSRQADLEFLSPTDPDNFSPHLKSLSHTQPIDERHTMTWPIQPSIKSVNLDTLTPLPTDLIDQQGKVNFKALSTLQTTLITPTSQKYFIPTRNQYFHVDGGANVHATNNKDDFMIYYPYRSTLDLAAGNRTSTIGFGVMLVRVAPNLPPIPLAPVFYCPDAPHTTLSPPALRLFNKCSPVLIDSLTSLSIIFHADKQVTLKTTVQNNVDFIKLPVLKYLKPLSQNPLLASIMISGLNEQLLHQRFSQFYL